MGELEQSILQCLWAVDQPLTPAEVHGAVAPDLAYTTVMTVLTRLYKKGLLDRERVGRAFAYSTVDQEAVHRAGRMRDQLNAADDGAAVLSSFVETLTDEEAEELRRLLRDGPT